MCVCVRVRVFVRACVRKRMERERERERGRERERESMCVLEIVREYFSTILQAFVVCSCFIVIETPRFMDKLEDIVKDFFYFLPSSNLLFRVRGCYRDDQTLVR